MIKGEKKKIENVCLDGELSHKYSTSSALFAVSPEKLRQIILFYMIVTVVRGERTEATKCADNQEILT